MSIRKAGLSIIVASFLAVPAIAQSTIASGSAPLTTAGNNVDVKTGSGGTFRFFNSSNSQLLTITENGWVGVGGAPGAFFHVQGNVNQYMLVQRGTKALYVNANWSGQGNFAQIAPRGSDNIGLSLSSNDNAPQYLYITPGGTVGINTMTPNSSMKLDVNGDANFNGTVTGTKINAHYQDVAEWVPSRTDLAPGTVVVLDAVLGNGVAASTAPYDTTVAGVVSAQPGLILGIEGDSKEQVATTGRVKVKVDASRGPIAVGDLLVTSEKPGYAMRSTPIDVGGVQIHRPGTIVGKALEPLREGQGEILVLLSLQ